jgi:hypothetical protein
MNFEQQLKSLILFHLEENESARHLLQVLEQDDFARAFIAPPEGIGRSSYGDAGPLLDDQARKEYKTRLDDLAAELEEAREFNNFERAGRLEEEREALTKELAAAYGLGGRTRKLADPGEKARKTISKAIGRTLEHIKANDLNLWGHLRNSLSLRSFPAYKPHPPVNWTI